MGSAVVFDNVSFSYGQGGTQVHELSLGIAPGEVVVLTGQSGSGKTTCTRLINGLLPHFYPGTMTGRVLLGGRDLAELENWERGRFIGNVFQDPRSQFFSNEVAGEIAFGCENYGMSHAMIINRVHGAASALRLDDMLDHRLRELSYGLRQRVAIASARAVDPEVYVFDEPSANLDMQSTEDLRILIQDLKAQGKTVIIAEHRLYYLMGLADRIIFLNQGRVEGDFTADEFRALSSQRIVEMGLRAPLLRDLPGGRPSPESGHRPVLEAKAITRKFGRLTALDGIDLRLAPGEVIALVGRNGAGKSVLGRVLSGLTRQTSGEVRLQGDATRAARRRRAVWYIGQDLDSQLFGESVLDELLTGRPRQEQLRAKALSILQELSLEDLADHIRPPCPGQKQRLALGVALMEDAPVLVLDEPTSGLDGRTMRSVSELLRGLARQGHAIVLITHDVECALACCSRVVRVDRGRVITDAPLHSAEQLLTLASPEHGNV